MMQRIGKLIRLSLLGLACGVESAFAGSITAVVDKTVGSVTDDFEYRLTISGSFKGEPKVPEVPGLSIQRVGQSSRTSVTMGSVSREVEYTYQITAEQNGKYTIPSVVADVDGRTERTVPITITVGQPGAGAKNGAEDARPFFIERTLSSSDAYAGEPVTLVTKIYSAAPIVELGGGLTNIKNARLFRKDQKTRAVYTKTVNGTDYTVVDIAEVIVPDVAGTLTIPAVEYAMRIKAPPRAGRRGFDDDFFGFALGPRIVQKNVRSDTLSVLVKKLPPVASGKSFSGLVGNFFVTGELSQHEADVGDSLTLTVTLKGEGVIDDTFDKLPLNFPSDFKVYPDKPQGDFEVDASVGLRSEKTFKYALVPTKPGEYDLGDLVFTTFVPKIGAYADVSAKLGLVKVTPGKGQDAAPQTAQTSPQVQVSKATPSVAPEDLLGLKPSADLELGLRFSKASRYVLGTLFLVPLFILAAGVLRWCFYRYRSRNRDRLFRLKRGRELKEAIANLKDDVPPEALLDYLRAIFGALLQRPHDALTQSDMNDAMLARHIPDALRGRVARLYSALERQVFSELTVQAHERSAMITELQAIHRDLNEEWSHANV